MKLLFLLILACANLISDFGIKDYNYGKVIYQVSISKETLEKGKANPKLRRLFKNASDVEYQLMFNRNESEYKKIKAMKSDAESLFNITEVEAGGKNVFYYNLSTKENVYSKSLGNNIYLITRPTHGWKITKKSKTINGYNCMLAILLNSKKEETNITAWFTPQIPLGYGPKNYNGLPGLILELNSGRATYQAIKINLSNKNIKIRKPKNGIKLSYKEFKNRFKGIFDDN